MKRCHTTKNTPLLLGWREHPPTKGNGGLLKVRAQAGLWSLVGVEGGCWQKTRVGQIRLLLALGPRPSWRKKDHGFRRTRARGTWRCQWVALACSHEHGCVLMQGRCAARGGLHWEGQRGKGHR
eukprot:363330-Chlamydomonas_euryale.AAC.30